MALSLFSQEPGFSPPGAQTVFNAALAAAAARRFLFFMTALRFGVKRATLTRRLGHRAAGAG